GCTTYGAGFSNAGKARDARRTRGKGRFLLFCSEGGGHISWSQQQACSFVASDERGLLSGLTTAAFFAAVLEVLLALM
ncbi:unnamed protein product, partial [Scytosiphon promiscuus]